MQFTKKFGRNKSVRILSIALLFSLSFSSILSTMAAVSYTWDDNSPGIYDDLQCFTYEEFLGFMSGTTDPAEIIDQWNWGSLSAGPDCVDIYQVQLVSGSPNWTLIIKTQGNPEDCITFLVGFFNCTNGANYNITIFGWNWGDYEAMGGDWGEISGWMISQDDDEILDSWDFSNGDFRLNIPEEWISEDSTCDLILILGAMNPYTYQICADLFVGSACSDCNGGSGSDDGSTGGGAIPGSYTSIDPITNLIDDFAEILFGWMCGSLPFIFFTMLLIVIQKILADRKSKILDFLSIAPAFFAVWSSIFYMAGLNLAGGVFGPNILNILTLSTLISFLAYSLIAVFHTFNWVGNNSWIFTIGFVIQFIIGVLYLLPWWIFQCPTAIASIIIEVILAILFFASLKVSFKYSYKKGGGKT